MKTLRNALISLLALAAFAARLHAQIQTAGTVLVNLDATTLPVGPTLAISNAGTTGGYFSATGLATLNQPVVVNVGGGANGIMFDGSNFMQQTTTSGGSTIISLPSALTGANAPYSIECWVVNPTTWTGGDEAMVSWGVQGTAGYQTAFGYSANSNSGAMDHNGNNLYWANVPKLGVWHHLVYTFDGTNQSVYQDGSLDNTVAVSGSLTPVSSQPITLAAERTSSGTLVAVGGVRGALTLGRVRIESGALNASQVQSNYSLELPTFTMAPAYPSAKPVHRYSFNNATSTNAVGATLSDTGTPGGKNGVVHGESTGVPYAQFSGTKLLLSGGSSSSAGYASLPAGLVSTNSVSYGGTGQVTLEGWVQLTGGESWPRLFDFGAASTGTVTNIGGTFTGVNYFMLSQNSTSRDWARCEINNNGYNSGPNITTTKDFTLDNINCFYNGVVQGIGLTHYAATWNDATGEVIVYVNGVEATRFTTTIKLNQINDLNCWLGRSTFSTDNNAQCAYDEFRIYNSVLSPAQVQYDYQAGPTVVNAVSGAIQSLFLVVTDTTLVTNAVEQLGLLGNYTNAVNVPVPPSMGTFSTSDDTVLTVSSNGLLQAVGPGSATVSVMVGSLLATNTVTVVSDPGTLNDIRLIATNSMTAGTTQQTDVRGDFANVSDVDMLWYAPQTLTLTASNPNLATYSSNGLVTALLPGKLFITATAPGVSVAGVLLTVTNPPTKYTFDIFNDAYWSIVNQANSNALVVYSTGASQEVATNTVQDREFQVLYNLQNGTFRIRNVTGFNCIGALNGGTSAGTAVVTVTYSAAASQQWYLRDVGGNRFQILNTASGLALQTDNGNPANVTLQPAAANPLQYWSIAYQTNNFKKGTASWDGDSRFVETTWCYDWGGGTGPSLTNGETYVPMLWGPNSSSSFLPGAFDTYAKPQFILGFNEPDNTSQSDMTDGQATQLWPELLAANVPLVSPGAQNNTDSWMNEYFADMQNNGYRVDYTTTHLYVPPNANSVLSDLQANWNDYGRPVWLTEFSPVDWSDTKAWSSDSNYLFLYQFMWQAEDTPWFRHYSMYFFSGTDDNPDPTVNTGQEGNCFYADGVTLTPYGELYATWDADRVLHPRIPYIINNVGTCFRLSNSNSITTPGAINIYTRNATTEWALVNAPTTNQWYVISLNDGRRLGMVGSALTLEPYGTTGTAVQWEFNGPSSIGAYNLENATAARNIEGTGSDQSISWTTVSSSTTSASTLFFCVKPYQPVAIPTALTPYSVSLLFTNTGIALNWSGGDLYYNVYHSGSSGGPYSLLMSGLSSPNYLDTTASSNSIPEYYVVTGLNILADESAYSAQAAADAGALWRQDWFGTTADTGSAADSANPAGDGIVNLLKRAFDLNPLVVATSGVPTGAVSPDGSTFTMTYQVSLAATDLTFQAVASPDLNSWSTSNITDVVVSNNGVIAIHAASIPIVSSMQFMQLQVTTSP